MEYPVVIDKCTDPDGRIVYTITTQHGSLDATFRPNVEWFCVANVDVERAHRRQGIAKLLLQVALEKARQDGAKLVYSAVTSRECLEAMKTVFGEEAISIEREGTYTPKGEPERHDTAAYLGLYLDG